MNKELMLIQFSKYMTIGTVSVIVVMIVTLIGLWIYSEWLIYQEKKNKRLDIVRDKMDGIEMKRLLRRNSSQTDQANNNNLINKSDLAIDIPTDTTAATTTSHASNRRSSTLNNNKHISLKSLDGLPSKN